MCETFHLTLLPFVLIWIIDTYVSAFDYCLISKYHTMCLHTDDSNGPDCPEYDTAIVDFGNAEIDAVLRQHNKYRSRVALGTYREKDLPQAADMRVMKWDYELEEIARRFVAQCRNDSKEISDVERFNVGQNIYQYVGNISRRRQILRNAVDSWFSEITNAPETFTNDLTFRSEDITTFNQFTQVIWSTSEFLGCGMVQYGYTALVACNYGPAGNVPDQSVYQRGANCSACPNGYGCSYTYKGCCDIVSNANYLLANITILCIVILITLNI